MGKVKGAFIVSFLIINSFSLSGQEIQNGDFEDGTTATHISQIYRADFWSFGCEGTTDLYDCQSPPPETFPGPSPVATPKLCINPRNNGLNNCRFGSIHCRRTFQSEPEVTDTSAGESLMNELSGNILPNVEYTIHAYVARGDYLPVIHQPQTRRIEAVLRTGNCIDEVVVPIPIDIIFNKCQWMPISASFQITTSQAQKGFKFIEFRDASEDLDYHDEIIFIDDVRLENDGRNVSLNDNTLADLIDFYPNPVKTELNIETKIPFKRAVIMDLMGNNILSTVDFKVINLKGLSSGIYLVYLEDTNGNKVYIKRFLKQ